MKALSLKNPYAWAIVNGYKPVENRDWKATNAGLRFRGRVLIHAGKNEMADDVDFVTHAVALQTGRAVSVIKEEYLRQRAFGAIVGVATVADCVKEHPSPWFFGPYAFVMAKPMAITPVPCIGMLGFFGVPADVLSKVNVLLEARDG